MPRLVALILHAPLPPGAGPLTRAFEAIRRESGQRHAAGFEALGATAIVDDAPGGTFGARVRAVVERERPGGIVVLGSGSIPIAGPSERRLFVGVAAGPAGHALANNRFSADVVAVAGAGVLSRLPDLASDNGLPRWLASEGGVQVRDVRSRWRLQLDLDSPLDALLLSPGATATRLAAVGLPATGVLGALRAIGDVAHDGSAELVVAGRTSAAVVAWLERHTASRTRALVEERGFRTRAPGQRPVRSTLGLLLDRDGPAALGAHLAELGDAALVDSRVLIAHRFGADESGWPPAEDRFASDLLVPGAIADPWLRALTQAAVDAPIPVVLGGHTLVGPGLRLVLDASRWT